MAIVTPVEAEAGARRRLRLDSPANLESIGEIEVLTPEDVKAAVARARQAQSSWGSLPVRERAGYMMKALRTLLQRQDEFMDIMLRETPKTRMEALSMDIFSTCDALNFYAAKAGDFLKPRKKRVHGLMGLTKQLYITYRPLGVVGVISPWNGPFVLSIIPTIQALMAGNAVVLKPSSATSYSGKLVGTLFESAGLPDGVLTVVLGDSETGDALLDSGVDKISFTGSVSVGRHVAMECARRLIPCTLELGGKDPMIVCADANLDNAAGGAIAGCFWNAGQYCCGTERVYVVESVADEFISKVVARTGQLRQAVDGEFDVGAIYVPHQMEIIEQHVADAVSKGARVLTGGRRNPDLKGLYYEPTVMTDVDHSMLIMTEETFGPVMPIMRVRDEEEAIRWANDTRFGLAANVWTRSKRKGLQMAQRIESGSVCVNDYAVTYGVPEAPFGGRKDSGIGRVNGEIGIQGYCHIQPILVDRWGGGQAANSFPRSGDKDAGMQKFMGQLWGNRIGRWLSMRHLLP